MMLDLFFNLKDVSGLKTINMDKLVADYPELRAENGAMCWEHFEKKIRPNYHIYFRPSKRSVTFTLADKENPGIKPMHMLLAVIAFLLSTSEKVTVDSYDRETVLALRKLDDVVEIFRRMDRRK